MLALRESEMEIHSNMFISFVRFILFFKSCNTKVSEAFKVSTLNFVLPLISASCYSFAIFSL